MMMVGTKTHHFFFIFFVKKIMANKEIVTVLTVKTDQSTNTIKGLKQEIANLKQTLDNAVIGTDEFEKASKDLATAQANLKTVLADGKKTTDAVDGSYNHLVATMAELKKQWRATADEVKRNELGLQIDDINAQLKELDASIGNYQRNVGDYANQFKNAFEEQQQATQNVRIGLDGLQKTASGLANGYSAVQGAMALLNIENAEFEKTMIKIQSAMAIAQGVGGMKDLIEGAGTLKVAFTSCISSVKAFTAGLNGMKLALVSTGVGALVVGLGMLVANWDKVTESIGKFIGASDKAIEVTKELKDAQIKALEEIERKRKNLSEDTELLKLLGTTDLELANKALKDEQDNLEKVKQGLRDLEYEKKRITNKEKRNATLTDSEQELKNTYTELETKAKDLIKEAEDAVEKAERKVYVERIKEQQKLQEDNKRKKEQADAKAKADADKAKADAEKTEADRIRKEKEATAKRLKEQEREIDEFEKTEKRKLQIKQEMAEEFEEYNSVELDGNGDGWYDESELEAYKAFLDQKRTLYEQNINAENQILQSQIIKLQELAEAQAQAGEDNFSTLNQIQELNWVIEDNNRKVVKNTKDTNKQKAEADKEYAENSKKQEKLLSDYKINIASNVLSSLSQLLGEESKAGKAVAVAQATIDTYQAANSAYKAMAGIPTVGPALGAMAAAAAVASGIANVKKIISVKKDGSGANLSASSVTPNINLSEQMPVQYTRQLLSDSETTMLNESNKVYVVESDITSTQNKVAVAESNSSF